MSVGAENPSKKLVRSHLTNGVRRSRAECDDSCRSNDGVDEGVRLIEGGVEKEEVPYAITLWVGPLVHSL